MKTNLRTWRQLLGFILLILLLLTLGVYRYVSLNTQSDYQRELLPVSLWRLGYNNTDVRGNHVAMVMSPSTHMEKIEVTEDIIKRELLEDRKILTPFIMNTWDWTLAKKGGIFNYLPDYKNPCWLETLPKQFSYKTNSYLTFFWKYHRGGQYLQVSKAFRQVTASLKKTKTRFRCLPAVYIAGVHKAGKQH